MTLRMIVLLANEDHIGFRERIEHRLECDALSGCEHIERLILAVRRETRREEDGCRDHAHCGPTNTANRSRARFIMPHWHHRLSSCTAAAAKRFLKSNGAIPAVFAMSLSLSGSSKSS